MTTAFRPVNTSLSQGSIAEKGSQTQTRTRTPPTMLASHPEPPRPVDEATTPTRSTFGNRNSSSNNGGFSLVSQKPLPSSPFPDSVQMPGSAAGNTSPGRDHHPSQHSRSSRESEDVDMDGASDGEGTNHDDGGAGASDDESVGADGSKSKKKKSQRFYCTDYPPCNLSFTRSEHLARHIRKHTGERPFQCHCSRRFSRLDNLRQHAQTVHVNEDIPIDSLAATGTRFQRQIRTDRVRQAGARARASTAGNVGPPARGHSKSFSTSSIASVSSVGSSGGYGVSEMRRRPPPLVTAADPRARVPLEPSYRPPLDAHHLYRQPSPSDFSTPTSATFSTGQGSPRWGSGVASPTSSHSRSHSLYGGGSRTPGRRLSVPSGGNPFYSPHGANVGRPIFASANPATIPSANSSLLSSPTASTSAYSRRDSTSSATDDAWRRRTWHPDTRDFNGASRLSHMVTPSQLAPSPVPLPIATPNHQPSAQPTLRLPGIESFDPLPPTPPTPSRRAPSPMMIDSDSPSRQHLLPAADLVADDRRNSTAAAAAHWDMGLHRGLTRLDINNTPPRDSAGAWATEANQAVLAQSEQHRAGYGQQQQQHQPSVRFETDTAPRRTGPFSSAAPVPTSRHQYTVSAPSINTSRDKRHGWYHGGPSVRPAGDTIPEGRAHVDRIVHPNVSEFQGFPARETAHPPGAAQPSGGGEQRNRNGESMDRLKALVAVATSEGSTATAC